MNLGLFCMGPDVSPYRHAGKKKTLEMLLTGDIIDAVEAERIGLLNKVVPGDKLEEETLQLASLPPKARAGHWSNSPTTKWAIWHTT